MTIQLKSDTQGLVFRLLLPQLLSALASMSSKEREVGVIYNSTWRMTLDKVLSYRMTKPCIKKDLLVEVLSTWFLGGLLLCLLPSQSAEGSLHIPVPQAVNDGV